MKSCVVDIYSGQRRNVPRRRIYDSRNYFISFVFFVKIIVVLLLVGFLPKSLYETRNGYREYVHVLNSPLEIQVATKNAPPDIARADGNILGTTSSTRTRNNRYLHKDHIQKLSDYVRHKKLDQDHPQVFKLHAVWIKVNQNRLLSVNSVPVRVINFLYRRLLECKCYMQGIKGTKRKEESNTEFVSLHDYILLNVIIGTLIGFKVTALFVLTFVSLIFYRHVIFTPIELKFQDFSRKLQKYLKENYTKTTLNTIVSSRAGLMGNCAIQVIPKSDGCKKCLSNYALSSEDGVPKLEAKYMVQFLDKHANTHIARSFFFECCYMDHFACPGSASDLLYTASRSFVLTTFYLLCVTAVLTFFGDLLDLTFYIQIVAFISAATLPFIIRNSVFGHSNESSPRIDQNDEGFRLRLENLLREFSQKWTVIDFEISEIHVDDLLQISTDSDYINKFESWFSTPSREFISVIIRDHFNERLPFLTSSVRSSISKQGKGSSEFTDRTVDILRTHTIQYNGRPPGIKRKEEKADSIPKGAEYTTDARERHKHHPQQTGQEILDFMRTLTDQGDGQDIHRTDMEYDYPMLTGLSYADRIILCLLDYPTANWTILHVTGLQKPVWILLRLSGLSILAVQLDYTKAG
ncbi:hypothetical protein FSP39_001084 [Pinctada imbricata]|uniref:Uncharacterized protein n=1 Tax=Pinctada imbricata TaxID=66713 RepID=A0AA88Y2D6_PINIB|nr:hypothetical protein FSP39_001084 [Pinctada imbricata]